MARTRLMAARRLVLVLVGAALSLSACAGDPENTARAIGTEASLPGPESTTTAPPPSTTSTAPPTTAVPVTSRPTTPTSPTATAPRPLPRPTTTTTTRPTTTTLPPAFQVPAENLRRTPPPLPFYAQPGYTWDTGWNGDPPNVDMTPPYQPPEVLAVTSTICSLSQHSFTMDTWRVDLSLRLKGGQHWRFTQQPTSLDSSDGSAGIGTFIEYIQAPVQPPDSTPGTVVDFRLTTIHLNSPSGMQVLELPQPITAHCTLR